MKILPTAPIASHHKNKVGFQALDMGTAGWLNRCRIAKSSVRKHRNRMVSNFVQELLIAAAIALLFAATPVQAHTQAVAADAMTDSSKSSKNFGTDTDLELDGMKTVHLQFDLSAVPANTVLKDAELRLWASDVKSTGEMWMYLVTSPWDESTLTDATAPSLDVAPFAMVEVLSDDAGNFLRIAITDVVNDWLTGAASNYGIALTVDPSAVTPLNLVLDSKENFKTAHEATLELALGFSDDDSDPENELNTDLVLDGTTLEVTDAGGTKSADLSSLDQSAAVAAVQSDLAAHEVADGDLDAANELQALSLSGNTLSLSGGGTVDLSGFLDNTDQQALSLSGNTLSLVGGGTVDLSGFLDNTDQQTLSLSGNSLSLSGGNSVDLSGFANGGDPDLATVLAAGNDAGAADMVNLANLEGSAQPGDTSDQDAIFTAPNRVYLPNAGSRIWQSWTAEATGLLTQVDVHHDSDGITDGSLRIYAGQGESGPLILDDHIVNGGTGWVSYILSTPVPVIAGQVYTVRLVDNADAWRWRFNNGDSGDQYAGGRASTRAIEDLVFRTYVIPNPAIYLSSGGIQVSADYLMPDDDAGTDLGTSTNRWRDIYASNGVIQTSDARLKSDIERSPYGLKEVLALRPVAYRWKARAGERMLGFLAQDVESVVPEAVVGGPAKGQVYGMNYTELLPVVAQAIQEQQAELEDQRKLINEQWHLIQLQQEQIATLSEAIQQSGR